MVLEVKTKKTTKESIKSRTAAFVEKRVRVCQGNYQNSKQETIAFTGKQRELLKKFKDTGNFFGNVSRSIFTIYFKT